MSELTTGTDIKVHKVQMVAVGKLKFDPDNPNVMSKDEMDALRESMKRFGYLTPIICDQEFMIADGEHRLEVYKEFGHKEVPCIQLELKDDTERRLLRQTLNKLHGRHDKLKDADEIKIFYDAGKLDLLAFMTNTDRDRYLSLLEKFKGIPYVRQDTLPETGGGDHGQAG